MEENGVSNLVIGLVSGAIIAIVSFALGLFGQIWYGRYQETRQRRSEALKKHFEELEEQYIKPTSEFLWNISNENGRLTYYNTEAQYTIDAAQTSWPTNELNNNFDCFKVHFAIAANELLKLEKEIKLNNDKNKAFNAEIVSSLENKSNIQVSDYFKKSHLKVPCFSHFVITFIRMSYMEYLRIQSGDKNVDDQLFNFHEVVYSPSQQDNNIVVVGLKDGRELAKVNNAEEAETCKKALIEIAEDVDLMKNGQVLYTRAEELKNSSKNLAKSFDTICEIYGKFGTVLKKNKKCPTCKLIR